MRLNTNQKFAIFVTVLLAIVALVVKYADCIDGIIACNYDKFM